MSNIKRFLTIAIVLLLAVSFGGWLWWATVQSRRSANSSVCRGHLKAIGLAFHHYHDKYGCFPPAYIADENGEPMHSWRILIQEFMYDDDIYDAYRFDEPWNSSHNLEVAQWIDRDGPDGRPHYFQCGNDAEPSRALETSYVVVVGSQTAFPGVEPVSFEQIQDPRDETILVVEVVDSGILWTEPRDLRWNEMNFEIADPARRGVSSNDPTGPHVLFTDGTISSVPRTLAPETLKALLTIAGGEEIDQKEFDGE